jgi:xanthine/CO dehydrogenase XdhC/CoxF family maturation factor
MLVGWLYSAIFAVGGEAMDLEDSLAHAAAWHEAGECVAIATVVETWGSSPRPVGSQMVLTRSGRMAGSVSGGCVEAALLDAALQCFDTGAAKLLEFGITDDRAWEVGLACGGRLAVYLERLG